LSWKDPVEQQYWQPLLFSPWRLLALGFYIAHLNLVLIFVLLGCLNVCFKCKISSLSVLLPVDSFKLKTIQAHIFQNTLLTLQTDLTWVFSLLWFTNERKMSILWKWCNLTGEKSGWRILQFEDYKVCQKVDVQC